MRWSIDAYLPDPATGTLPHAIPAALPARDDVLRDFAALIRADRA